MVQCTARLGLVTFARRLYTVDGEQISDVNQLRNGAGDETGYDIGTHHNKDEKPVKV